LSIFYIDGFVCSANCLIHYHPSFALPIEFTALLTTVKYLTLKSQYRTRSIFMNDGKKSLKISNRKSKAVIRQRTKHLTKHHLNGSELRCSSSACSSCSSGGTLRVGPVTQGHGSNLINRNPSFRNFFVSSNSISRKS